MNRTPRLRRAILSISLFAGLNLVRAQDAVDVPPANANFKEMDTDGVPSGWKISLL
jgi:hypothetical protein